MFKLPFDKLKFGKIKIQQPVVVVEIGNDWLKIAEYAPSSSGGDISRISLHKLAQIKDSISVDIARVFKELSLNKNLVVLCIPRHLITVRTLDLPSTDPKEIGDMISLQIGKQTPYSKDNIVSSYKIINSTREGYTKVILAVAHRSIVNERVETLRSAGITIGKVSISSEGVYNWFSSSYAPEIKAYESETITILDIDSNFSDFMAVRNGKLVFTKNIFIGANHLLEKPEAWGEKLIEELKRSLKRYYMEERNTRVEKMFLTGAVRDIDALDLTLTNALEMMVEKTDTFKSIAINKDVRAAQDQNMKFVSLTAIVGAAAKQAMLEIDLTPSEQKIQRLMEKKRRDLTVMGILFVSIVMVLSFFLLISLCYKNVYLAQLKKKSVEILKQSGEIDRMRLGAEIVRSTLDAKNSSLDILHEIYSLTPPEISFRSIDIDENKQVILKGRGFVMSDIFKFMKKLEDSRIFTNVKASYTRTKKEVENDKETEYAEFEIICPYKSR